MVLAELINSTGLDVFSAVLGFLWIVFIWERYLSHRQHKIYETCKELPAELTSVIDEDTFTKSRVYALDKSNFGSWNGLWSQCLLTAILWFGGLPYLWHVSGIVLEKLGFSKDYEILQSLIDSVLGHIFYTIIDLPWTLYMNFVIEERHGFNKMTLGFYLKDLLKKNLVSQAITLPLTALLIYIIQVGGDYFFIYTWAMVFVISMILMHVYPEFIAPLFDKYSPLPEGQLKTKIEELAASLDYPLKKLYVVEGSKRSSHSNAYMYGFRKNKRIVLFDTLLEDYSPVGRSDAEEKSTKDEPATEAEESTTPTIPEETEVTSAGDAVKDEERKEEKEEEKKEKKIGCNTEEVVAVLGHELGHWYHSHMVKNLVIMQFSILFSFFMFGLLMNESGLFEAFGFIEEQPTLIRIYIIFTFMFSPINEIESFLMNILSRKFEFQADEFAVNLGKREKLKSALLKLFKDNLSFPIADWMYSARHYSHPPLLERLRAMDELKLKSE